MERAPLFPSPPFPAKRRSYLPKPVAPCPEILGTRCGAGISVFQPFQTKTPAGKGNPQGV